MVGSEDPWAPRRTRVSAGFARRAAVAAVAAPALAVTVPAVASAVGSGYQWKGQAYLPITKSTGAEWTGKLKIADTDVFGEGYKLAVECSDKVSANLGTNGAGEVTAVSTSGCVGLEACKGEKNNIVAVNLPWHTELAKVEGTPREVIVSGGKGTPGFRMVCKWLGIIAEDTCTGNLSPKISALENVALAFNKSDVMNCNLTEHKGTGYTEGSQTIPGIGIEEGTPIWVNVTKEEPVSWSKGTLTLIDRPNGGHGAPWSVTCEESGAGTVATVGKGSVSGITLTGCKQWGSSECNGTDSIEALHLPWKTQLYLGVSEAFSDAIMEGTAGVVAFKIKCESYGLKLEDTCEAGSGTSGRLATFMTNGVESGVRAKYYALTSGVGLNCHRGGGPEESELHEGSHVVKLSGGGTLSVSG